MSLRAYESQQTIECKLDRIQNLGDTLDGVNEKVSNINVKLRIEKTDQFTPREGTQVTIIKYCTALVTAHQPCSSAITIHNDCCYSTFF